jgi:hypothetical protein
VNRLLRLAFFVLVRPVGAVIRSRDPLRLQRPATTNWRTGSR